MNDERELRRAGSSADGESPATSPLPSGLQQAVDVLREDVEVRPEWRAALMTALEADDRLRAAGPAPEPGRNTGRVPASPLLIGWQRAAAALALLAVGALGGSVGTRYFAASAPAPEESAPVVSRALSNAVGVRFTIVAPTARHVSLVGDFNGWSATETPLVRQRDSVTWMAVVPLPRGRHAYSFVIDGDVVPDPTAPRAPDDDFGVPNSVILVSAVR